jgi:hypothetical protein
MDLRWQDLQLSIRDGGPGDGVESYCTGRSGGSANSFTEGNTMEVVGGLVRGVEARARQQYTM